MRSRSHNHWRLCALAVLSTSALIADTARSAAPVCSPLRIEPGKVKMPTLGAAQLHAVGGSRTVVFSIEGDAHGAEIEPGGGLRASAEAGTLTIVARDGLCKLEARAQVDVVGPFVVEPQSIAIARGATVEFVSRGALGDVGYTLLDAPTQSGKTGSVDAKGRFAAGDVDGTYHLVARDGGSGREARLVVSVGKTSPLRPRAAIVAVPAGVKVRLDWRGGSGSVDVAGVTGTGKATSDAGVVTFEAPGAKPGFTDVAVVDRFTKEKSSVRVLVGDVLGASSTVRGTQTGVGDMVSGDVNGDGIADLIVGHAERSKTAFEAGGILVYYGKGDGTFVDPPDTIEGDHPGDRYGSVLLVRDVNGDGIDDIVSGVPDEDLGESKRGEVSILLGAKGGLERDADRVLAGEAANHRFGSAIALADLTGDGAPELVASAPGARSPFQMACDGGRVYVYRNEAKRRGVMAAIPWQVLEIRDTLSDDPEAPVACSATPLGGGRALALIDMDGDKAIDLVVGAPASSYPQPGKSFGTVLVYRGTSEGKFEAEPSWAIHLDAATRPDGAAFGSALDVVRDGPSAPPLLVVRSASYQPIGAKGQGALWIFAPGSLGVSPASGSHKVKNVTTKVARSVPAPDGVRGFARSAAFADVDPHAGLEYVVGVASAGASGGAYVYAASDLAAGTSAPTPLATIAPAGLDLVGFRIAALRGGARDLGGLALWAPWRTTAMGPFVGAIDFVAPGATSPVSRWATHASLALPNFGASDRAGAAVQLASLERGASPLAIVGAPGAHSPTRAGHSAGEKLRTGTVDLFGASATDPIARASADRQDAQIGSGGVTSLDFDGDGVPEIAVADPGEASGGPPGALVDPDGCSPLDAKGNPVSVGARGVVHLYALVGGQLVERFRVTAPKEAMHVDKGIAPYWMNRTGFAIAAADVNGDGKEDLILGRPGGRDSGGAEVVLGRKGDANKVVVACSVGDKGPMGATSFAPATPENPVHYGAAVAKLGDLDRDGCDEIAVSMRNAALPNAGPPRAGIAIAFGYDASGAHCGGHRTPFLLRVVPDDHPLAENVIGDTKKRFDDLDDLRGAPTSMGSTLARGFGDFTGDGVPDLVFRDADLTMFDKRGPAVEIVSGAFLASLCPNRVCPKGRSGSFWSDGDWNVVAMRALGAPSRRVVPSGGIARGFGSSIVLGDVSGDGVADLAIGWSDDIDGGAFAGELRIFRGGGTTSTQDALLGDPWLIAVGDVSERGAFGASASLATNKGGGGWLLVGAPQSTRSHAGGAIGAAYRWAIEVPK